MPTRTEEQTPVVELTGSLSGIGLLAVVELIGEVHHSGNLELRKSGTAGTLAFDDGRLVAAEYGEHHGLQALADCVTDLSDGDFTFIEGVPTLERTLDVGQSDLKRLLDRISSGEFDLHTNGTGSVNGAQSRAETTCPLLGFADDNARHYSRPTALHRCYSGGAPSLVSAQEQRDLCLSGRFAACPRFRNAEAAEPAGAAAVLEPAPPNLAVVHELNPPAAPTPPPAPEIPPGVAARLAASNQMHMSGEPATASPPPPQPQAPEDEVAPTRPTRGVMLIIGGAVLGFLLVGLVMLVILPALRPAPSPAPAALEVTTPATAVIVPPAIVTPPAVATAANATRARVLPTLEPRPATPTALPQPTPIASAGRSLMDVRFAGGPAEGWVDHAPYAAWSDGAFRFQARDAAHFVAVGVPINQVMSDVIVQATFRKTGGPPGGGYGLIVRDQGPEPRDGKNQDMTAYVLETGDLGEYGIWRRDGDHWVDLVPWMRSASVRSGGSPNDLEVRAIGDQLIFNVNGADVATVQDDALAAGGVGLFVGGDYNEVALDHFSVELPN